MFAIDTLSHMLWNYWLFVILCASQTFGHRRTRARGRLSDAGTTHESCRMYSSFAYSFIATTLCALTWNLTQSRKSKCVWLSTSIIVNYLWWVAHHKCSTTEYRLRWQCEHKWVARMKHLGYSRYQKQFYRENCMHHYSLSPTVSGSCGKDPPPPIAHTRQGAV